MALNTINEKSLNRLNQHKNDLIDLNNISTTTTDSSSLLLTRRSRTVPTTPKHTITITSEHQDSSSSSSSKANQNQSNMNKSLYWEGPPAHFMLPTHADHCRSSRSIERCPRAKGKFTRWNETINNNINLNYLTYLTNSFLFSLTFIFSQITHLYFVTSQ